ncbi:G-type lectin S-receptor-like serine/threonine-protein kinase [Tanacetum coccineum]
MNQIILLLTYISFLFLKLTTCSSLDTLAVFQNFTDGDIIVSGSEQFEMGFFSPGRSKYRYLGIWVKNTSPHTVVWVANRETPLIDNLGMLKLDNQGILSVVNSSLFRIWSSNSSISSANVINPIAQLLDSGNLVIKEGKNVVWQSFDYPGDTFIAGMKLGKDLITGREMFLTAWTSADDPSPGEYTLRYSMNKGEYIQVYIWKNSVIDSRIGPYNGLIFAGLPNYKPNPAYVYKIDMIVNDKMMYCMYTSNSTTFASRSIATPSGKFETWQLNMHSKEWMQDLILPMDYCDNYGLCGLFGSCNTATFPSCSCLKGFELKNPEGSGPGNWTSGCIRSTDLDCGPREGFLKFPDMKLPDTQNAIFNGNMSLQECEVACKDNCSCVAYANPNVAPGGVGCLRWFDYLIDVRVYPQNGQDLYVRLASSELLGHTASQSSFNRNLGLLSMVISISTAVILMFSVAYSCKKKKKTPPLKQRGNRSSFGKKSASVHMEDLDELPFFSLHEIAEATDNFSINNKIGEGGFGPVYKGVLEDGRHVAVKRLAETSQQGLDEFKNEVICIAKLQHRNLVKLFGYCIHKNEMILIYEYMANKSLDTFIFDENRSSMLDWPHRFNIINGMARGILYLHQDSRIQIIHRDLKAGNILLDADMNPKITDFGLARKFAGSDSAAKTKKVVGTYGYISPEYAVHGNFSIKSDVFSFGVLTLEIVSGKKNRGFTHEDHSDNLLGHAWRLYKENRCTEIMCPSLLDSCVASEVVRSIQVGLLCVQNSAKDRPTMMSVVLMLVSGGVLPKPKQPAFYTGESHSEGQSVLSVDERMITQLHAR